MINWTAVVLTCPNKNSSLAYQKELQLRQQKGFIDKESLVISIEGSLFNKKKYNVRIFLHLFFLNSFLDPEAPIGSGGATLNALYTVAEALSAKKKYRVSESF